MPEASVQLTPLRVALQELYLDPNNPRFARSLKLEAPVPDAEIASVQQRVRKLFVHDMDSESSSDDDDAEADDGAIRIGDLIRSMQEIGFVPIDRVVVRRIKGESPTYVVIEGNRRVSAAKYLHDFKPAQADPTAKTKHEDIVKTLRELDVLLLVTDGLTPEELHNQIGVILGLRHFGSVLGWGTLAKAVNIYNEYRITQPTQAEFRLEANRVSQVATRLSETRSNVKNALKTYIAYQQMQIAFTHAQPKPAHYSLLQACVVNRKLATANFIEQDGNTFTLSAASLEQLNIACEFENRDRLKEDAKILRDPKAVSRFASLVADASSNRDTAVRAFAASLLDEVVNKERSLDDAGDNLRSFKSDRVWTESLEALLAKVVEPGASLDELSSDGRRTLLLKAFQPSGNDLLKLEDARKAFKNVRTILSL